MEKRIKSEDLILFCVSLAGLVIRFCFRDLVSKDMSYCLLPWYRQIAGLTLREAMTTQVGNYNVLYQNIILVLTRLPGDPVHQYKAVSVLFDYILAMGAFFLAKETAGREKAVWVCSVILLLPSVWLNSAAWGQCDSMYVAAIVWSLYFLYKRHDFSSFVLLGIALALKLQTVFIFPFYAYLFLAGLTSGKRRIHVLSLPAVLLVPVIAALPNLIAGRPLSDIYKVYLEQTSTYESIFMNYPSFWSVLKLQYHTDKFWCIGFTFLALGTLMLWFYFRKAEAWEKHFLRCAFVLSYTCVLFLPSMHERYGYLYEILAVILSICIGRGYLTALILQLITLKTYLYYLYDVPLNMEFLGVINTACYLFAIYAFYRELKGTPLKNGLFERNEAVHGADGSALPCGKLNFKVSDRYAVLILVLVFLVLGSMHLGSTKAPETTVSVGTETETGREIHVYLEQTEYVDSVCVYQKSAGKEKIGLFYEEDGAWISKGDAVQTAGVFSWNRFDMKVTTHEICLLFSDPEVEISEIVCFGKDGNRIAVRDTGALKELFDEQECLAASPTGFDSMIFDEIYHGRTAYEFLNGLSIYENTHPPLGKLMISVGIALFGMNPFGYRIMSLLFGTMLIPVMYLFALRITGKSEYALAAGILQGTEFMQYTLSRIATIDIFVAFFVMCMFYFMVAFLQENRIRYLILSGAAFAFGIAVKWTAAYAAAGIGVVLLVWMIRRWKSTGSRGILLFAAVCSGSFVVLPCMVYCLSYIPFAKVYPDKGIIGHAVSNSVSMLKYHSSVTQSHPFASPWYTWLFDAVPLVDSRIRLGEYKSVIATFVNPFICYCGLASVFHHIYLTVKKDRISMLLLLFYLCMLIPWMFISRTVFIYQYFICTKILILMICNSIRMLNFKNEGGVLKLASGISVTLFAAYLPVISGIMAGSGYIDKILRVLPKWWF